MMLPVYLIAVVVNIIAKNNNYNIKPPRNPDFDVRVRRDAAPAKYIDFDKATETRYEENDLSSFINALEYLMSQYEDKKVSQNLDFDKRIKRNGREGDDQGGDKFIDFNQKTAPLKQEENKVSLEATLQHNKTGENSDSSDTTYKNVIDSIAGYSNSEKRKELSETIASILQGLAEVYTRGYNDAQKAYNLDNVRVTKRELNSEIIEDKDQKSDTDYQYTKPEKTAEVLKELATTINEFTEAVTKYLNKNPSKKLDLETDRVKREVNSGKNTDSNMKDATEIKDSDKKEEVSGKEESADRKDKLDKLKPLTRSLRFVHDIGLYGATLIGSDFSDAEYYDAIENNDKNIPKKNPTKVIYNDDPIKKQLLTKEKPRSKMSSKDKTVEKLFRHDTNVRGTKKVVKEKPLNKNKLVGMSLTDKSIQTSIKPKVLYDHSKEKVGERLLKAKEIEYTPRQDLKPDDTNPIENLEHSGKDVSRFDDRKPSVNSSNDSIVKYVTTDKYNFKPNMNVTAANNKSQTPLEVDKTFEILELFDEIEDILDLYIQESNLEEETISDDIGTVSRTKSNERYELTVDETDIENHDNKKRKTRKQKKNQSRGLLNNRRKTPTNYDTNKINDERKSKLVKRDALPENVVSNFFYNIYSKVYNLTHTKKDDVEDNIIPSTDSNYNFYGNQYSYNQNYSYNDHKYENNHKSDNSMTHSAYINNNYGAYVNPADIKANGYSNNNYGYNLPATNGYGNNPTYNYNYAHGYAYNQPLTNGPVPNYSTYNSYPYNQYGYNNNGYNVPTKGYDVHENYINTTPDYKINYGNSFNYDKSANIYDYNTPPKNGYSYNTTLDNGYGYNATVVNGLNANTTTEKTIMEGCVFCSRIRCQKNYKWVGVACMPIGQR